MDLPKILLTGLVFLFFLVFFEFLDNWVWESKKTSRKTKKTKKKQFYMDLPKILLTGLVFFVFFVFLKFLDVFGQLGLGQQKPREKPNKPKKTKKPILNGLTQDSSHRIVFFVFFGFLRVFGQLGLGE